MSFNAALLWPAFEAAEMLVEATVLRSPPLIVMVGFMQPDIQFSSAQSRQYEIEYQTADLPELNEGDELEIAGERYRVRQPSFIVGNPFEGNDGTYTRAILTKL